MLCLFDTLNTELSGLTEGCQDIPTLAGLAAKSQVFTEVYTPNPDPGPARASLLTGLDPSTHGVWASGVALPDHIRTLPELLRLAGYSTSLAGRWQLAGLSRWTTEPIRPGTFNSVAWAHGPLHRSRQNTYLTWLRGQHPDVYSELFTAQANPDQTELCRTQMTGIEALPDNLSFNHWVGHAVCERIEAHTSDQPFCAIVGFSIDARMGADPRSPTYSPRYNRVALQQADTAIKAILESVHRGKHDDDTVIAIASSTGLPEANGQHSLREPSVKTPLLLHGPRVNPGLSRTVCSTIDILPSLLESIGLSPPTACQGRSLLGPPTTSAHWALSRLRASADADAAQWQSALRCDDKKLIITHHGNDDGEREHYQLYDLANDPLEAHNLATDPRRGDELERLIDTMIDARCARENRTEARIASF